MPTNAPILRNSMPDSAFAPHQLRKKRTGNSVKTVVSESVITQTITKEVKLLADVDALIPINVNSDNEAVIANRTGNICNAITLESGIIGAKIKVALSGDLIKFPDATFTDNELVWLGAGIVTQTLDIEDDNYSQVLGIAISDNELIFNIENPTWNI